jgi:cytidylate kinase
VKSAPISVTIDGPAGVGKSTVGRRVARELQLPFLDTGLLYRALALVAAERAVGPEGAAELVRGLDLAVNLDPRAPEGAWRARIGGRDLGAELWAPGNAVLLARIAAEPAVRAALLPLQRRMGGAGVVAVGRDAGSTVFPHAEVKVYLDAPFEVRMERRRSELERLGLASAEVAVREDLAERDHRDRTREAAPLAIPEGAMVIDTAPIDAEEVARLILRRCHELGVETSTSRPT